MSKKSAKRKAYGRQADGKTIKSISLDANIVEWAQNEADQLGISFSEFISKALKRANQPSKSENRGKK